MISSIFDYLPSLQCLNPILELPGRVGGLCLRIFGSLPAYVIQLSLYRHAIIQRDSYFGSAFEFLAAGIVNLFFCLQGAQARMETFDPVRRDTASDFLAQFAKARTLTLPDGSSLEWVFYESSSFTKWVESHGGVQERGRIRPATSENGSKLSELATFKWFKKEGESFQVPEGPDFDCEPHSRRCVLLCPGFGPDMTAQKGLIGMHLSAGFDIATLNWRRYPTPSTLFEDGEAVYRALIQEGLSPDQITVLGSCRATFVATKLFETHQDQGTNLAMIYPPPSLRDAIDQQILLARMLGHLGLYALPEEAREFDNEARLKNLGTPSKGRLCPVMNPEDPMIPKDTEDRLRKAAQSKDCTTTTIWEKTSEDGTDPHYGHPFKNYDLFKQYTQFLTAST